MRGKLRKAATLLRAAAALSACRGTPPEVRTIDAVIAGRQVLKGKTVSVRGYVAECEGFTCRLNRT